MLRDPLLLPCVHLVGHDHMTGARASAVAVAQSILAGRNCTVDAISGNVLGECTSWTEESLGGCSICPVAWAKEWSDSYPNATGVKDAILSELDGASCEFYVDQLVVRWTYTDSLWFAFVLLTTVGYGNTFTPTNVSLRYFMMVSK